MPIYTSPVTSYDDKFVVLLQIVRAHLGMGEKFAPFGPYRLNWVESVVDPKPAPFNIVDHADFGRSNQTICAYVSLYGGRHKISFPGTQSLNASEVTTIWHYLFRSDWRGLRNYDLLLGL